MAKAIQDEVSFALQGGAIVAMCSLASKRTDRVVTLNSTPRLVDRGVTVPGMTLYTDFFFLEPSLVNPNILRLLAILSW